MENRQNLDLTSEMGLEIVLQYYYEKYLRIPNIYSKYIYGLFGALGYVKKPARSQSEHLKNQLYYLIAQSSFCIKNMFAAFMMCTTVQSMEIVFLQCAVVLDSLDLNNFLLYEIFFFCNTQHQKAMQHTKKYGVGRHQFDITYAMHTITCGTVSICNTCGTVRICNTQTNSFFFCWVLTCACIIGLVVLVFL
eukprot:TRINITY_DN7889_c1_g1_i11.p2 TRINITY_DN7889_c1_g1~~TRINITY_DN7889_c1_g1_i11.p2  ORF type:complete len:192 (-),score=-9.46 TRINITY_DN7889_c1_g1_i11:101-676(-)